jgi:hypothetical protein
MFLILPIVSEIWIVISLFALWGSGRCQPRPGIDNTFGLGKLIAQCATSHRFVRATINADAATYRMVLVATVLVSSWTGFMGAPLTQVMMPRLRSEKIRRSFSSRTRRCRPN